MREGRERERIEYEVFGCWVSILLLGFMFFDSVGFDLHVILCDIFIIKIE